MTTDSVIYTKSQTKTYYGIELKPGYSIVNLWAMPLCLVAATVAGTFINTEIIFLLKSPDYFGI